MRLPDSNNKHSCFLVQRSPFNFPRLLKDTKKEGAKSVLLRSGQGRIRTAEAVKQQIYSLPVLTTYLPTRCIVGERL